MKKRLFVIPIDWSYGGGYSVIIKADTLTEAQEKAQALRRAEDDDFHSICDDMDLGEVEDFDYFYIDYLE